MLIYLNIEKEIVNYIYKTVTPSTFIEITDKNFINLEICNPDKPMLVIYKFEKNIETKLYFLKEKLERCIFIGLFEIENLKYAEQLLANDLLNYLFSMTGDYKFRIAEMLNKLLKDNEISSIRLSDAEKSMITSFYIYDLIYGDLDKLSDIKSMGNQFGLYAEPNCAITLKVDNFWEICRDLDNKRRYELKKAYLETTRAAINELEIDAIVCSLIGTDKLVVLANTSSKTKEEIINICKQTKSFISNNIKYTVTIGIGNVVNDTKFLWKSYDEAFNALDYSFYIGGDNIIHFDETKNHTSFKLKGNEMANFKYIFFRNINNWKKEEFIESYNEIINYLIKKSYSSETIKSILIKFNFEVTDYVLTLDNDNRDLYECVIKLNSKILRASSLDLIKEYFSDYIEKISNIVEELKESDNLSLGLKSAKIFIDKYYYKDLSLQDVAMVSNMSESYFSRKFKEVYGYNYIDYLLNVRLKTAKELLDNSEESITEISQRVGFNDSSYFSKKFKEKYGQAPYIYKKSTRN